MSWYPCQAEDCENGTINDAHPFCAAHDYIQTLTERMDVAVKALEFYGNKKTYEVQHHALSGMNGEMDIEFDSGKKAREALAVLIPERSELETQGDPKK